MKFEVITQLLWLSNVTHSFLFDIYCGKSNCYKVLGVKRNATNLEITEAFNKIELKYNPEKNKHGGDAAIYHRVLKAYNVLKTEAIRTDYDIMMDDPYNLPQNYYLYFKHSVLPNVDVQRLVVLSVIIISFLQYFYKKHKYSCAVLSAMRNPKNRSKCLHKIQEERILQGNYAKLSYWEEEKILRQMVEKLLKGKYTKPKITDTLFVQIVYAPYYFFHNITPCSEWLKKQGFFCAEYEDMPTLQELNRLNADMLPENLTPLDESSEESRLRLRMWLNGIDNHESDDYNNNNNYDGDSNNNEDVSIDSGKSHIILNKSEKVDIGKEEENDEKVNTQENIRGAENEKVKKQKTKKKSRLEK